MGYVAGADRLHPPRLGHQQPVAAQGAPGPLSPSGPRCSTTSPTTASSGAPAAAPAATSSRAFNILDTNSTKAEWDEVVREIPRMWEQVDYSYHGEHFTVPTPHNILPKPYGKGHPPIWVACGNPPTFAKAGELGIGAIAFNFEPIYNLRGRIEAYKEAIAELHRAARPVHERQRHDDERRASASRTASRPARSRSSACSGYLVTMVNLYHDTMPKSPDAITWPNPPIAQGRSAAATRGAARPADRGRLHAGRHARRGLASSSRRYKTVGCDQVVFGLPAGPAPRRDPRDARALRRQGHPRVRPRPACTPPTATAATAMPKYRAVQPAAARRRVADGDPGHRALLITPLYFFGPTTWGVR